MFTYKAVLWYSNPVTVLPTSIRGRETIFLIDAQAFDRTFSNHVKKSLISTHIALQVVFDPHTQHCVTDTTSASDIQATKLKTLVNNKGILYAAYGAAKRFSSQPFYIPVTHFSAKIIYLSNHIIEEYVKSQSSLR